MTTAPIAAALPRCLCLAGPTASGKSAAAMAIADAFRGRTTDAIPNATTDAIGGVCEVEIVSVDSALVYRGMDVGTAKPSAAERARVPHHLIDIIEPTEAYSAARFVTDATRLIREIDARGRLPLLVGGTMLYFKALFEGLDTMPAADAAVRAEIEADAVHRGWPALHAELARVDPASAARLAPGDAQRVQRALEVFRVSGRTLSSFHTRRSPPPTMPPLISLEPLQRSWLHQRIEARFRAMLDAGLVDEVRALRERGDLHPGLPSMRCVGYRQTWDALDAGRLDGLEAAGSAATRQLAKRQLTWLRGMPQRQVIACDAPDAAQKTIEAAKKWRFAAADPSFE